jgi:CNT family concentrative nucleoside transporter
MSLLQSAFGLLCFVGFAWAFGLILSSRSKDTERGPFPWKFLVVALGLQIGLALLLTKVEGIRQGFYLLNTVVIVLQDATREGTSFVFGYLGGGAAPFDVTNPASTFVLAFQALPLVILVSALSALLFHWRILPMIVRGFAWALNRSLRVSGSVGIGAAANIFVGMIEAPLFIRPYVRTLTRADLFMIMTCGMATIAGTMLVLYATFLQGVVADPAGQLLVASVISAPAALLVARLMIPAEPRAEDLATPELTSTVGGDGPDDQVTGAMDAVVRGTLAGVGLLLNITAMLMVMVALVYLTNGILGLLPNFGDAPITLQRVFGWVFAPAAWLMGLPWSEAVPAGQLLGTKTVLNELIAYLDLSNLAPGTLSDRSKLIVTYALCGFANFASLGIMIGGLASIAPTRRSEIVELGGWSLVSGTLSTMMTGAVIGLIS